MKIKIVKIRKTLEKVLVKKGVLKKEARIIADEYLEGELQGKLSHGLMAFPSAIKKVSRRTGGIEIIKKTKAMLYLNANYNFGAVVGKFAVDRAIATAEKQGVALVVIKNLTTWLRPGTIARWIAEKDFIGFVVNNGGKPRVAPPGGYQPVIATNPFSFGIPTLGEPIVADMATSKKAWGEVRLSEKFRKDLPQETYFDQKGNFAKKPKDAYSALPTGDYKGFALGLLIEILTGSMLDILMGSHKLKGDYRTLPRGGFILVVNPSKTTVLAKFKKANSNLVEEIKRSKKLRNVKEIFMPGERALKTKQANMKKGYLEVEKKLWQEIKQGL